MPYALRELQLCVKRDFGNRFWEMKRGILRQGKITNRRHLQAKNRIFNINFFIYLFFFLLFFIIFYFNLTWSTLISPCLEWNEKLQ